MDDAPSRLARIDEYIASLFGDDDPALVQNLADATAAGLPPINVSANQGRLLYLLAKLSRAERVLEIGTLGGYSTIWLARALPAGGRLVSLEVNPDFARVARANIARAGLSQTVEIVVGPALQTLPAVIDAGAPFDLVFIDADKPNNAAYVEAVLPAVRTGGVIVVDNVVRGGALADAASVDPSVRGSRALLDLGDRHPRLDATVLQTVGVKGYDGMFVALVT